MTADADVFGALMARVSTLVLSPAQDVAWPGQDFDPAGAAYLRPSWLPSETAVPAVAADGSPLRRGLLQVTAFAPEGTPLAPVVRTAGAVAAHFTKGTVLDSGSVRVRVEDPPSLAPPVEEPGWVSIPVSVPYVAYERGG